MNTRIFLTVASLLGVFVLGFSVAWLVLYYQTDKTAYVDTSKLYNGFTLKKELEQRAEAIDRSRQNRLDSLQLEIRKSGGAGGRASAELEEAYARLNQQFSEDNALILKGFNEQIWKHLNQYVQDYGREHDYAFIYGGDGTGTLMYAGGKKNITDEVLNYVNRKYKGLKP